MSLHYTDADRRVCDFHYLCARGARRFVRPGLERSDLEQVAALGLVKASRRYDASKETPFEAYAWLTILGELMHYVRDDERVVRIPRRTLARSRVVAATRERLTGNFGREATDVETAQALGLDLRDVATISRSKHFHRPLPLDDVAPRSLAAHEPLDTEDRLMLARAFSALQTFERHIIAGVYLLGLTQSQLASALGTTPKRVSRVHLGALARMRSVWLR